MAHPDNQPMLVFEVPVVIAEGESLSAPVFLATTALVGIQMPEAWDAADLSLQCGAAEAGPFLDVYKEDGTERTIPVGAGRVVGLEPASYAYLRWARIRSGTSGTPVEQSAQRDIVLLTRLV